MDYQIVVTAAGKSHFVAYGSQGRKQIVRSEKIATSTGMQWPNSRHKRQQLFLTLASPTVK